jgi:DNA polymerase III alpha subunit
MENIIFQNYHRHDIYTNPIVPDTTVSPKDYAIRAKELGHSILSSVQHGWVGRYIETIEIAREHGLKPIIGVEAYFVKNRLEKDKTNAHIILLAKNENGRKSINRIMSEANLTGYYYRARIDTELLFSLPPNDVFVTSACVAGVWKYEDADLLVNDIYQHFGRNFYLEVQCHLTESQRLLNQHILELSNKLDIPIIFGADSHFIYPEQSRDRDDFLLSKHIEYEDEQGWYMDYPDGNEVVRRFQQQEVLNSSQIKEALNNTNILLEVEEYKSKVFEKVLKLPSLYPEKTQEEKDSILEKLIWNEWDKEKVNVSESLWNKYVEEINKELKVVIDTKMADYFLLDQRVVARGKELNGSITMTGRGSAPSFYISKLLGLTTIDRISATVKLFPERFITTERILEAGTAPDIDLNLGTPEIFAQAQSDVLGEDHSYPMIAYGTLKPKAAWKLYARAKNVDFEIANNISGQIEQYEQDLKHADEEDKESIDVLSYIDKEYHETYLGSKKYLGIVSDWKIHPCAYLLFQEDIKEEIGLVKIKSGNTEHICSIMDGLWAENYKFIKNDLLKVSVVDLIYRVYEKIGIKPHPLPELIKLCENNGKVWEVYANAWTMGINQVEQTGTSGRVAKYKPQNISELSAFVAAVRPGFQSNYKQFEAREQFCYGIKSLDEIIQTEEFPQSYMIYQENSMQVLAYAGIPISKTFEIVKSIAKKRYEKVLKYKEQFLLGMKERLVQAENLSNEEAEKVAHMTWQIIEDSSRYSFNSSHAYSVAGDSLYGAYLKSHYPLQFYEAFLQLMEEGGDKDRLTEGKVEAEKAYKIKFPPYKFGQDNRKIVSNLATNEITSSISSIKGFGSTIGEGLFYLNQFEYGNFIDFLIKAEDEGLLSKKYEDLIKINYFDRFGCNKKLFNAYAEFTGGKSRYSKTHTEKTKQKRILELKEKFVALPDEKYSFRDQINFEKETLGYILVTYPKIDKKYVYILESNIKYAPRLRLYCLANGKMDSVKVQQKLWEKEPVMEGDLIRCDRFEKKNAVSFVNGKYVENPDEKVWWLSSYSLVNDKFDEIIKT